MRRISVTQARTKIKLSPGVYDILTTGLKLSDCAGVPLLTLEGVRITGPEIPGIVANKVIDYTLGALIFFLTVPVMVMIGVAIWLSQVTPILHRYKVVGLRGRQFSITKFHTGLLNSSRRSLGLPLSRQPAIGRSSRLGAFLYRTGLDKLPHFWNILAGDMSLVGPRAVPVSTSSGYDRWLADLLTVKPGVTGGWAVSQYASLEDELRGTLCYIRNWNPAEDIAILLKTIFAIVRQHRATTVSILPPERLKSVNPAFDSKPVGM